MRELSKRSARWPVLGVTLLGLAALGLLLAPAASSALQEVKGSKTRDIDQYLKELYDYGRKNKMWNVSPADGRFLQVMVGAAGAKRVLELGTANGYSGIWIARTLRETGGKLITIEIDEKKAKEAQGNFARVGMSDLVEVKAGDVAKILPTLSGPFDVIFMDTEKRDYLAQFKLSFPLLRPGGLFIAHNVVLLRDSMKDFLKEIENHPDLVTSIAQTSDDGFSVSYRKR